MKALMKVALIPFLVIGLAASPSFAQGKKIATQDLPAAVAAAFKASYPNAEMKGAASEVVDGATYYRIESRDGKVKRGLLYTKEGRVFEVEETLAADALPAAVKQALAKAYPKGTIKIAARTTRGKAVTYGAKVRSEGRVLQVRLDEKGVVLDTKEIKKKKRNQD